MLPVRPLGDAYRVIQPACQRARLMYSDDINDATSVPALIFLLRCPRARAPTKMDKLLHSNRRANQAGCARHPVTRDPQNAPGRPGPRLCVACSGGVWDNRGNGGTGG